MVFDFVVLGALGMQGRIVCRDLLEQGYSVLMVDRDKPSDPSLLNSYKNAASFVKLNVENREKTRKVIKRSGADTVINCADSNLNLSMLKICADLGLNSIDLGSSIPMTRSQLGMDAELKEKNAIHITGCGSVPGVGNVMMRHAAEKFDTINTIEVGFVWDSNIKKFVVPYSIVTIAEEFMDYATVLEDGKFVRKMPMESVENRDLRVVGRQRCFLAAWHPEAYTFHHYFRHAGVKNVRFYAGFPDHSFDTVQKFIELGMGSSRKIDFYGTKISPVDFLASVLRKSRRPDGYKETETLWLKVYGEKNGKEKTIEMECVAPTLDGWEDAGCNVDTGIPVSIVARMIKNNAIKEKGSFSPEGVVPPREFFEELAKYQMLVYENGRVVNKPYEIPLPHPKRRSHK